jgi:hypothetical protein
VAVEQSWLGGVHVKAIHQLMRAAQEAWSRNTGCRTASAAKSSSAAFLFTSK